MKNERKGTVIEVMPNSFYRVDFGDVQLICYISGKMKVNRVAVSLGDKVQVTIDPYGGKTTNRITRRL